MTALEIYLDDTTAHRLEVPPGTLVVGIDTDLHGKVRDSLPEHVIVLSPLDLPLPDRQAALSEAERCLARRVAADSRRALIVDRMHERLRVSQAVVLEREADASNAARRASDAQQKLTTTREELESLQRARADAQKAAAQSAQRVTEITAASAALDRLLRPQADAPRRPSFDPAAITAAVARLRKLGVGTVSSLNATDTWARAILDGTAPLEPDAQALLDRLHELGLGRSPDEPTDAPGVVAAQLRRSELERLIVELESLLDTGALNDAAVARIRAAEARRADVKPSSRRRSSVDELGETEMLELRRYGFDSYLDFDIAMSSGLLRRHAREKLQQAQMDLSAAIAELESAHVVAAEEARRSRAVLDREIADYLGVDPGSPTARATALQAIVHIPTAVRCLGREAALAAENAIELSRTATAQLASIDKQLHLLATTAGADEPAAAEAAVVAERAQIALTSAQYKLALNRERWQRAASKLASNRNALMAERARCDELRSATYDTADLTGLMCMLSTRFEAGSGACTDEPPPLILFEALSRITPADAIGVLERVATHPCQRILYVTADDAVLKLASKLKHINCVDLRRRNRRFKWFRGHRRQA